MLVIYNEFINEKHESDFCYFLIKSTNIFLDCDKIICRSIYKFKKKKNGLELNANCLHGPHSNQ